MKAMKTSFLDDHGTPALSPDQPTFPISASSHL